MVEWDRGDYVAEASKQLNEGSVYENVIFKDTILQDLTEKSDGICKCLKPKGKITEKKAKVFHNQT